ncbi:MAG: sle1, partial [Nonomuraea muscovyensis]|nr:sle1 [Nonomuraea muscovyensis]
MSEWNLSVRLTGQGSNLRSTLKGVSGDARTASRNVRALKQDIAELRRELRRDMRLRLDVDLHTDRAGLRREVQDAISWAQAGQRIEIPITLQNPMQLRRDVSDAVRWASMNQVIRVRVTPDTSALRTPLPTPGGGGASAAAASTAKALGSLLPVATALIPLVAGLTPAVLSAASSMGIGALAAGAYGAALAGQVGPLKEAAEAEQAYQDAVAEHGASSREAAQAQLAYQRQLSSMPPETQKAAVALSRLKTQFGDWSDDMSEFTMAPVTKGMTILGEILPHLSPEVKAFSGSMDRLVTVAGGAINTPGFDHLSDRVAELTEAQLDDFTDSVIHLLRVLSEGGTDAGVIGQVINYMRENGPAAREALNSIGDAVGNVLEASSQAGPTMLTLVTAVADLVAAIPPQAVAVILQAAVALKVLTLAGAAGTAAAAGITAVRTAILGMTAASVAAGGGLAGLRAAFLSLGTAAKASIVVAGIGLAVYALHELSAAGKEAPADLDKVTSSLKRFQDAGKLTGESARVFGKDFEKLGDSVQKVSDPEGLDQFQQSLTSFFGMDS